MKIRLADLHNDAITKLSQRQFFRYIRGARKVGVETILISVWTTEMQDPIQEIRKYKELLDDKLLLHIEDAWFVNETNVDELIKLEPYSVGLTWNQNNNLAGGAHGDGGLTPLGETVIKKLSANGIRIDLAHLNRTSFYQVAEILGNRKLLCTHTCFDEVHPHLRNLDRKQIQTIVNSGGIIGLTLVRDFLGGDVYSHIRYFIDNFGEDNIAIGTDFYGTVNLPKGLRRYKDFARFRKFLLGKGIGDSTINKIFHINWHDFQRTK